MTDQTNKPGKQLELRVVIDYRRMDVGILDHRVEPT